MYCGDDGASVAGFVEWVGYVLAGSRLSTFDPVACAPAGPFQVILVTPIPRQVLASPAAPASTFDGDPEFLDSALAPQAGIPVIATRAAPTSAAAQQPVAVAFVPGPVASPAQSVDGVVVTLLPAASATPQPAAATASPLPPSTAPSAGTPIVAPPVAPASPVPTSSPQPTTAPAATAIPATAVPSATAQPAMPTSAPVSSPTAVSPTVAPPTAAPPTAAPPTLMPTLAPTMTPTDVPTLAPTAEPTSQPTAVIPTATAEPPATPTEMPTLAPPPQITQITLVVARAQSYESLGGVSVQIFEQGGSTPLVTRVTNEAGQIRLMLPPGGYRICASAGDSQSVSYPEGGCYYQTLQPGSAELMFLVS